MIQTFHPVGTLQREVLIAEALDPKTQGAYVIPLVLRWNGPFDKDKFISALHGVARSHEMLRATFPARQDFGEQAILDAESFELDVSWLDRQSSLDDVSLDAFWSTPFKADGSLLWRAAVTSIGDERTLTAFAFHHSIADGDSLHIFSQDLARLYQTSLRSLERPRYSVWLDAEQVWLRSEDGQQTLRAAGERWRAREQPQLGNKDHSGLLPTYRGFSTMLEIDPKQSEQLLKKAAREGCTVASLLIAAAVAAMCAWTGWSESSIAVPYANRSQRGADDLFGLTVNVLPLHFSCGGSDSTSDLALRAMDLIGEGYDFERVAVRDVLNAKVAPRSATNPLPFAVFQTEQVRSSDLLQSLNIATVTPNLSVSKFETSFKLLVDGTQLRGLSISCREDAWDRRAASDFAAVMKAALLWIVSGDSFEHFSEREDVRAHLRALPPQSTGPSYDQPDTTLVSLIQQHASESPGQPALHSASRTITREELLAHAGAVASGLVERHGIGPHIFGVELSRSTDAIVAMLGVLLSGSAYLPLNPRHPSKRNRRLAEALQVVDVLDDVSVPMLLNSQRLPLPSTRLSDLAYVLYTSGSTGEPKAVAIDHRALVRIFSQDGIRGYREAVRRLHISPYTFDASILEVWVTLAAGGTVIIPDENPDFIESVTQGVRDLGADTALFISPQFHLIVDLAPDLLASLDSIQVGGDTLSPQHALKALGLYAPDHQSMHLYGPTESAIMATAYRLDLVSDAVGKVPIGRPVGNTSAYVLDRWMRSVGVDEPGELFLAGPGLAWGYLGRSGVTAGVFVPNPFSSVPGDRMYATGDMARWRPDGELEFLGRRDSQVKVRGFRVELEEIEHALRSLAMVQDAAVALRADLGPQPILVAYVVAAADAEQTVRRELVNLLPDYMIPAHIVVMERLPLTVNGKLDRNALPAPPQPHDANTSLDNNPLPNVVQSIWERVLEIRDIPRSTKFFEAGGDSVSLLRVLEELRRQFPSIELELTDLFVYSSQMEQTEMIIARSRTSSKGSKI